jgi:outer membrane receptor protein involved in Fe transport
MTQKKKFWIVLISLMMLTLTVNPAAADNQGLADRYTGRPVFEVIDSIREQGYPIAYSSQLVPATLLVMAEPVSQEPIGLVAEIIRPHGLMLKRADGIYLVVRDKTPPGGNPGSLLLIVRDQASRLMGTPVNIRGSPPLPDAESLGQGIYQFTGLAPGHYTLSIEAFGYDPARRSIDIHSMDVNVLPVRLEFGVAELEDLAISTSRYVLFSNSQFYIDQRAIENLPDIGDDPIRSVHRLPGAAAGGWSARSYFRGGEENETAIFLNGLQLLDPFHVRDYQNIFSSIDARSISGVEAYTGGFPANYGDHMSGMLLLESQLPEVPRSTELGISVFNTSLLTSGYAADGKFDWLVSGRLSNLEHVLDANLGQPSYNDIFLSAGINFSLDTRLSINALRADDSVLVVVEPKAEEREQSDSNTLNESLWLTLENQWTTGLSSITVLSSNSFSNDRFAFINDPEQLVGKVSDDRKVDIFALKQDWHWDASNLHTLRWGFEARRQEADYRYLSEAEYFGFYLAYPYIPETIERDITASVNGNSYALYLSDRIGLTDRTKVEFGVRWDKQTYTGTNGDDQLSPRVSLFHNLNPQTELRLTWGRYHQSQAIEELQVEDGVDRFFPAQQADHLIAGFQYRLPGKLRIRAEAYQKNYRDLRPRFENLQDSLALIPELEPDRARIAPDSARSRGFELTVENRGNHELDWWASYSWAKVTDSINGSDELRNWDQKHAVQAGIAWHRGPWELGLALNVHSGWPTTSLHLVENMGTEQLPDEDAEDGDGEDEDIVLEFGPRNAQNFAVFASVDFRVSREWPLRKGSISAFFELSNAFDRKNECCIDYDIEDEDADELMLEESIDLWLPILPAVGVLWKF